MRKVIYTLLTFMFLGIISSSANAEIVAVLGARSCGKWLEDKEIVVLNVGQRDWIVGFLSGLAVAQEKNFLSDIDIQSIVLWVDNYCRANPLKHLVDAGVELSRELRRQKKM